MKLDVNAVTDPRAFAVLLHPHPDYGGSRFHPFVDALFNRLPDAGVGTIRFDFSSAAAAEAHAEAASAVDDGVDRWPAVPCLLVGYSFGAGVASTVAHPKIAGWYLLAPQVDALTPDSPLARDPRPKAISVPEHDQFSPPERVRPAVANWEATTVTVVPGADHFLGDVGPLVTSATDWIRSIVERRGETAVRCSSLTAPADHPLEPS